MRSKDPIVKLLEESRQTLQVVEEIRSLLQVIRNGVLGLIWVLFCIFVVLLVRAH